MQFLYKAKIQEFSPDKEGRKLEIFLLSKWRVKNDWLAMFSYNWNMYYPNALYLEYVGAIQHKAITKKEKIKDVVEWTTEIVATDDLGEYDDEIDYIEVARTKGIETSKLEGKSNKVVYSTIKKTILFSKNTK